LNNLAALVLYKVNRKKFEKYVEKILKSSARDILWLGAIGHHSEISSAEKQEARGCVAQAWSAALYIELINEASLD
jgi:glycogen debranching enzyme